MDVHPPAVFPDAHHEMSGENAARGDKFPEDVFPPCELRSKQWWQRPPRLLPSPSVDRAENLSRYVSQLVPVKSPKCELRIGAQRVR